MASLTILLVPSLEAPASISFSASSKVFIPPAAFAALLTNDLFDPAKVAAGDIALWGMPLLAAAVVLVVGAKTKSMAACIVVGVGMLAVLTYVPALL